MEDDQNGRRPKWKTTKMEDDQNGSRNFFQEQYSFRDLGQKKWGTKLF